MNPRNRLIVCLDGTWNMEDSSTNVLHHFNLIRDGDVGTARGTIFQKKQYFRGVGTGPLDRITGGGFGFGLEQNVRDAYDWLVEQYDDGQGNPQQADEIFIFGFSRGAYTARSLVGLIASYGLLRHGAPLPVSQLWENYCLRGRQREKRTSMWDKLFPARGIAARQITDLMIDPWLLGRPPRPVAPPDTVTEDLLVQWSRRAKITYLGVYDTVGAIGWDALAIPGLRSKLALHHNMRPTTIIQKCRHAMALDEYRSSFSPTPFIAYLSDEEIQRVAAFPHAGKKPVTRCLRTQAMWNSKIQQRWFVGAHSNLGGGYPDNVLAQRPLEWILEGAAGAGLVSETFHPEPRPAYDSPLPNDSYSEFAWPFWTLIIRGKRFFRAVVPEQEARASRPPPAGVQFSGFVLKHVNEELDESVFAYYAPPAARVPPNLLEYARRVGPLRGQYGAGVRNLAAKNVAKPQMGPDRIYKTVWALVAVYGLIVVNRIFLIRPEGLTGLAGILAFVALWAADEAEYQVGFALALHGKGSFRRAAVAVLYWVRTLGFLLFAFGAVDFIVHLCGWTYDLTAPWLGPHVLAPDSLQPSPQFARHGGLLLLLLAGVAYVINGFTWVGAPMNTVNLGSILPLQLCRSPQAVMDCLVKWWKALACGPGDEKFQKGTGKLDPVRAALWYDMLGFIPLYSLVLGYGVWLSATRAQDGPWPLLDGLLVGLRPWLAQYWYVIPIVCAVADYLEDICHLQYLAAFEREKTPPAWLTIFSFSMSMVKFVAFSIEALLTTVALVALCLIAAFHPAEAGWRGLLALSICAAVVAAGVGILIWSAIYRSQTKTKLARAKLPATAGKRKPKYPGPSNAE